MTPNPNLHGRAAGAAVRHPSAPAQRRSWHAALLALATAALLPPAASAADAAATATAASTAPAAAATMSAEQAIEENAYTLGLQAYLWGFPLQYYGVRTPRSIELDVSRLNSFRKYTQLKTAKDRTIVTPNNVTIDAYGSYDVSKEPVVVQVPALAEPRWYLVQIGSRFDEVVRNIGGIHGAQPGAYLITGPDFRGPVPGNMIQVPTPTKIGVVAARVFIAGDADVPKAVRAQQGFQMMPLSAYLREGAAWQPKQRAQLPRFQGEVPADLRYFAELGFSMQQSLSRNADRDDAMVAALHRIGLSVADGFDWASLDAPTRRGLARAAKAGAQIVDSTWKSLPTIDGWRYTMAGGRAGHDFALRAAMTKFVVGAQLAEEVVYPNAAVDDKGEPLNGANRYVLHFDKDRIPPALQFWNLSLYGDDMYFVDNDFGRYSIGSTTDGLKKNADGSVTVLIQKDRPADTSNWLPAPAGSFNLTMRFYGPTPQVLDGSYRLPGVRRVQ